MSPALDPAEWQRRFRKTARGRAHVRRMNLRSKGIEPEAYDAMLAAQGGVCAVCGEPETRHNQYGVLSLAVDTDHDTLAVRGLLCMLCNRALGMLRDDPAIIKALLAYRLRYM